MKPDDSEDFKTGVELVFFVIAVFLVCWNDWQLGLGIILLTGKLNSRLTKIQEKLK